MRLFAVSFLAGELAADGFAPSNTAVALALLVWLVAEASRVRAAPVARALAAALCGATLTVEAATPPTSGCWLASVGEGRKVWLEGVVLGPVVPLAEGIRLITRSRVIAPELGEVCGRVLLTVAESPTDLRPGDRVRFHASLRRPADFRNPRAYRYSQALARDRIWVTGGARRASLVDRPVRPTFAARVDQIRSHIRTAILSAVAEPAAGLLRALILGEQGAVVVSVREVLTRAGLAHLLSVSGLHVAAVWGLAFAAVRWILARSERLLLSADVRALAAVGALVPASFYAMLAGGSVPTERSIATAALGVAAWVVGRESRPMHLLALAALAVGFAHPGSPASISFQLSFVAVFALVLAAGAEATSSDGSFATRGVRWAREAFRLSFAVTLATAPLVALHFQRAAPIGLVTNPLLVPVLGIPATVFGLMGGALALGSAEAARPMLAVAAWMLDWLVAAARLSIAVPGASFSVAMPTGLELAILYGALVLPWIGPRRRKLAALALALVALGDIAFWLGERGGRGELSIRFIDVGQGDAAVLELPDGRVAVIDGGGLGRGSFDVGERVVAPVLAARKIRRVDLLIATHGDRDHQGGLRFLARELAPHELWIVDSDGEADRLAALVGEARTAGAAIRRLSAGDHIVDPSGVRFECLHPPRGLVAASNDRSLVLRIVHGERSFLFAADVEARAESMIAGGSSLRPVDVLKVPHHGSSTSSGKPWVTRLAPDLAVISVGVGNPYGAPSETVIRRHRRVGTRVVRTDRDGSVLVESDGRRLSVRTADEAWPLACSALGLLC